MLDRQVIEASVVDDHAVLVAFGHEMHAGSVGRGGRSDETLRKKRLQLCLDDLELLGLALVRGDSWRLVVRAKTDDMTDVADRWKLRRRLEDASVAVQKVRVGLHLVDLSEDALVDCRFRRNDRFVDRRVDCRLRRNDRFGDGLSRIGFDATTNDMHSVVEAKRECVCAPIDMRVDVSEPLEAQDKRLDIGWKIDDDALELVGV